MLLQFILNNYRSFENETILNMIPVKSRIHPKHIINSFDNGRKVRSLPMAVFYGANASGKSNFIHAISFARKLIIKGTSGDERIKVEPFKLNSKSIDKPSRFEFVFKHDGILYTYGFAVTEKEIKEEWLFAVIQKQEVCLFERITKDGKVHVEIGSKLATTKNEKQRMQFLAEGTRPNQLYLTEANERNVEIVKSVIHWFRNHLVIIWPSSRYHQIVLRAHDDKQFTSFLTGFLSIADTGITDIEPVSEDIDFDNQFKGLTDETKNALMNDLESSKNHSVVFSNGKNFYALRQDENKATQLLTLKTKHKTASGKDILFETHEESDGTRRMMHLAPALLDLQTTENTYIIDELDRSLHPHLCKLFVDAFLKGIVEKGQRGQMIITTHETSLLDLDLLRRDEIWFVEKDKSDSSNITSLSEFKYKVRADHKIDKGYLSGRFGAIPYLGDVRKLFKKSVA